MKDLSLLSKKEHIIDRLLKEDKINIREAMILLKEENPFNDELSITEFDVYQPYFPYWKYNQETS